MTRPWRVHTFRDNTSIDACLCVGNKNNTCHIGVNTWRVLRSDILPGSRGRWPRIPHPIDFSKTHEYFETSEDMFFSKSKSNHRTWFHTTLDAQQSQNHNILHVIRSQSQIYTVQTYKYVTRLSELSNFQPYWAYHNI